MKKTEDNLFEMLEEILNEKLNSCAQDNGQFGFSCAIAFMKHILIRVPPHEFGELITMWVNHNAKELQGSNIWDKAFARMSDEAENFLDHIYKQLEEEESK